MGTRADFYVGRGPKAEWLGSIAWDGYPQGIPNKLRRAQSEKEYRKQVRFHLWGRDDTTYPRHGWPWPWPDSITTDVTYAFDNDQVYIHLLGDPEWTTNVEHEKWERRMERYGKRMIAWAANGGVDPEPREPKPLVMTGEKAVFPDMQSRRAVAYGPRSGLITIGFAGPE